MQSRKEGNICHDLQCEYNLPAIRPHTHVMTNNGGYVRFIIDKPKTTDKIRSITDADTWG
jgi:hypothetical protein